MVEPTIEAQFVDISAQPTAAVRVRRPMSTVDVGALMDDAMSRLGALFGQVGATPAGPPYARYHAWGGELADVEIGFPLAGRDRWASHPDRHSGRGGRRIRAAGWPRGTDGASRSVPDARRGVQHAA